MQSTVWDKLQAIDRRILYIILMVTVIGGLFIKEKVPAKPAAGAVSLYAKLSELDGTKPVLIQSDWTTSTRGENLGHLESLLRILMAKNIKFAMYSAGEPQGPGVYRDVLITINTERKKNGLEPYKKGVDYLDLGAFPNAEGALQAMGSNLKSYWGSRTTKTADGQNVNIFQTPILQGVTKVEDCAMIVVVTASQTIDIAIQRLSGRLPIGCMCTGVVAPSILPYLQSGQVVGLAGGLKGVYDMEMMMDAGINVRKNEDEDPVVASTAIKGEVPPVKLPDGVQPVVGRGTKYYAALNVVLALLIFAIILGNVAMFAAKSGRKS